MEGWYEQDNERVNRRKTLECARVSKNIRGNKKGGEMGKVKQAIQEVEEEVVSLVSDIPRSLVYVQKRLPELLKDNPYANDKELVKNCFNKAVWERDNEEEYHETK